MATLIDCHQHFWQPERGDYGWLTPDLGVLYRDYMPADLQPLLEQTGVQRSVLVQAAPTVDETRFMLDIAAGSDLVIGVVGWVNMEDPSESVPLLQELSLIDKFVGIRPMIQDIEDPDWMLSPSLEATFIELIRLGLCFDALVLPEHLPNLLTLLERHPDLKAVVDHGAKPNIDAREMQPWADHIAAIAERSDAFCKVSGLITETSDTQTYDDVIPYCDRLLECFGANRLMWGSDWPVLNLRGSYNEWYRTITGWLSPLTEADRDAILGGNAARFYALSLES